MVAAPAQTLPLSGITVVSLEHAIVTCLVFSSQFHLETPAPIVDSGFHFDTNSSGVWYSRLEWGRTAL